jgi:hypothetical protein
VVAAIESPLVNYCPHCGAQLTAGRFCSGCGVDRFPVSGPAGTVQTKVIKTRRHNVMTDEAVRRGERLSPAVGGVAIEANPQPWEWVGPLLVVVGGALAGIACLLPWYSVGPLNWAGVHVPIGEAAGIDAIVVAALGALMFWPKARLAVVVCELLFGFSGLVAVLAVMLGRLRAGSILYTPGTGIYLLGAAVAIVFVGSVIGVSGDASTRLFMGAGIFAVCAIWVLVSLSADSGQRAHIRAIQRQVTGTSTPVLVPAKTTYTIPASNTNQGGS